MRLPSGGLPIPLWGLDIGRLARSWSLTRAILKFIIIYAELSTVFIHKLNRTFIGIIDASEPLIRQKF